MGWGWCVCWLVMGVVGASQVTAAEPEKPKGDLSLQQQQIRRDYERFERSLLEAAENMRRKVHETTYTVEGLKGSEQVRTTVTCGVAMIEGDPSIRANEGIQNRDQLLRAAMIALASGQQGGQNRVVVYRKETPPQQKAA